MFAIIRKCSIGKKEDRAHSIGHFTVCVQCRVTDVIIKLTCELAVHVWPLYAVLLSNGST